MQHINNILKNVQHLNGSMMPTVLTSRPSSTSPNIEPNNALFVWREFTAIYGNAWLNEFGERPNHIWIEELAQLSPRDIETGLNQCKRSGSNFAPRLPQFLAYCVPPIVEDWKQSELETVEYLKYRRLKLSNPEVNKEIRKAEIAKMLGRRERMSDEERETRRLAMEIAAENLVKQQEVAV